MKHSMKFYPVGNGDCSLVNIGSPTKKMMFDCNFRQKAENEDDEMFDVLGDLINHELTKKYGLPFLDAFLLTHPDQDHCRGFGDKFFLGDPDSINDSDKKKGKILIGELWYSPRVFEEYTIDLSDDAKAFKKRRLDGWNSTRPTKRKPTTKATVSALLDGRTTKILKVSKTASRSLGT